jgi:hypothetical protein
LSIATFPAAEIWARRIDNDAPSVVRWLGWTAPRFWAQRFWNSAL